METLLRSLNYDLQFDKEAQHILENSRSHTNSIALDSTPTITTLETVGSHHGAATTTTDFLQKLGASIINSIQLQTSPLNLPAVASTSEHATSNMDFSLTPHQVIIDSHTIDELQKQVEYDQLMNEVWIGIVLILILISMVFCFCSCFLYHQFRVWKNNYRTTIVQNNDDDSVKINLDLEDPVPEYTLVSGLPSYEAALELLHKNPQSCLIVHPSVFEVFNRNEKSTTESITAHSASNMETAESQTSGVEASTPLLSEPVAKPPQFVVATLPSYQEANAAAASPLTYNHSFTSISLLNEKSPLTTPQFTEKCQKSPDKSQKS